VEQLQLSVEDESDELGNNASNRKEMLIRRMAFLKPPSSWTESEDRRRLFWYASFMKWLLQ
jgi:hypothetical protein